MSSNNPSDGVLIPCPNPRMCTGLKDKTVKYHRSVDNCRYLTNLKNQQPEAYDLLHEEMRKLQEMTAPGARKLPDVKTSAQARREKLLSDKTAKNTEKQRAVAKKQSEEIASGKIPKTRKSPEMSDEEYADMKRRALTGEPPKPKERKPKASATGNESSSTGKDAGGSSSGEDNTGKQWRTYSSSRRGPRAGESTLESEKRRASFHPTGVKYFPHETTSEGTWWTRSGDFKSAFMPHEEQYLNSLGETTKQAYTRRLNERPPGPGVHSHEVDGAGTWFSDDMGNQWQEPIEGDFGHTSGTTTDDTRFDFGWRDSDGEGVYVPWGKDRFDDKRWEFYYDTDENGYSCVFAVDPAEKLKQQHDPTHHTTHYKVGFVDDLEHDYFPDGTRKAKPGRRINPNYNFGWGNKKDDTSKKTNGKKPAEKKNKHTVSLGNANTAKVSVDFSFLYDWYGMVFPKGKKR